MTDILKNDNVIFVDVDDTLILYKWTNKDITNLIDISLDDDGYKVTVLPHEEHIEMLKNFKGRGQGVVVWSQGGFAWAERVVRALALESYVDIIMTKPKWYADDLDCNDWMPNRIYLRKGLNDE